MSVVNIPVQPIVLAVIIGLLDLFLVEVYKFAFCEAQKVNVRYHLYSHGEAVIYPRHKRQNFPISALVLLGQLLILSSAIWLELSISSIELPSSNFISSCCITPERLTRTINRYLPKRAETQALGPFILPYIEKSGCRDSLVTNMTRGTSEYTSSFLPCLPAFQKRPLNLSLRLQGSAIGHVANDIEGDPIAAYGIASEDRSTVLGEDSEFGDVFFEGTTFFGALLFSYNTSSSFWRGNGPNDESGWEWSERIISNAMIPEYLLHHAPTQYNESNTGYQNCTQNNLACYHEYAKIAHSLKSPIKTTFEESRGAVVVTSHRNLESSICIVTDKLKGAISWVRMEQFINLTNTDRQGRNGPVPTMIDFSGSALCIDDIGQNASRIYSDILDSDVLIGLVEFGENGTSRLTSIGSNHKCGSCKQGGSENCDEMFQQESAGVALDNFETIQIALQWAVVAKGMMTESGDEVTCETHAVVNGSSIGKVELIVAIVIGIGIFFSVIISAIFTLWTWRKCPLKVDPLNVQEMLRHLLKAEDKYRKEEGETPWGGLSDAVVVTLGQRLRSQGLEIGASSGRRHQAENDRSVEFQTNINHDIVRGNLSFGRINAEREPDIGRLVLSVRKTQGRFVVDLVLPGRNGDDDDF